MTETQRELSPAQREIMDLVWAQGEVTASELRALLPQDRDLARNTVRTMLERMEVKGWLQHRVDGRTYVYSATRPREATIGAKIRDVIDDICGGSPETLVTALLNYRGLSADELKRVRHLLDGAKADRTPDKRKKR